MPPIRLDARLFALAPPREAGTIGRPRRVGKRLPLLKELAIDLTQAWQLSELEWYGGTKREMYLLNGTAVWYSTLWAEAPLPVRWVLIRDPKGKLDTKAFFSTDLTQSAISIGNDFVKRWNIEVAFEESRAHLGVESQRQWSDLATLSDHSRLVRLVQSDLFICSGPLSRRQNQVLSDGLVP